MNMDAQQYLAQSAERQRFLNKTKEIPIIHMHFLTYLPQSGLDYQIDRHLGGDRTGTTGTNFFLTLCPKIIEEGFRKFKNQDYIEAEDNFILAISLMWTQDDDDLPYEFLKLRYKAAFHLVKCGLHLGHMFLIQRFTEVFVSFPKVPGVRVNESELMACINSSFLHTRRRRMALMFLRQNKLCLGYRDVEPYGPPDAGLLLLLPAVAVKVIRKLLKRGHDLFNKGQARDALEFFRNITSIRTEFMERGIDLPGFSRPGAEFDTQAISYKCLILLGEFRRMECVFCDGVDVPIPDDEIKELLKRSKATLLKKRSVLAVLKNYKRCRKMTEAELLAGNVATANALYKDDKFQEAIDMYTEVLDELCVNYSQRDRSFVHYNRGSAFLQQDKIEEAKKDFDTVLQMNPQHEKATAKLETVMKKIAESKSDSGAEKEAGARPKELVRDHNHNLPNTFPLPHIPSLAHYRTYLNETNPETALDNVNKLMDEGLKCYSEEDYIEAEDKFMLAIAICEKFSSEGFKEKTVCRTAASWLLKCGLLTGNSSVVRFYAEYLVSLPTVTPATIPFVDATLVDVINASVLNTSRRVLMLVQLQQYGLCENKTSREVQPRGPLFSPVEDDLQEISRVCHQFNDEGKQHLDRGELVEALEAFRSARSCMLLNSQIPRGEMEVSLVSRIIKCMFLLGDFRRIRVFLSIGAKNPLDDDTMKKLLEVSKAPAHRKAAVLIVLHEFGSCLKVTEKDLYDPAPDVAKANSLYREDKFQEAVDLYNEVLNRIGPKHPKSDISLIKYNRGSALLQLARRDFEKTVQLNPDHEKAKKKLNQTKD